MNRLKNMNGYSKYLYGSIMDIFRKMTCPDKMKCAITTDSLH